MLPLSLALVQCGKAPNPEDLAANAQVTSDQSLAERFPTPQFHDRFPTASEALRLKPLSDFGPRQTAQAEPAPYRVASLDPQVPSGRPTARDDLTTLVSMKSSAFPYFGTVPASEQPFLNIAKGDRRGHRSLSGRVYWQDQTYNDNRVLMHVPENFDVHKPGVIVVFFHGNGATLERDVRDRQLLPQQITDSGVNAVLLAPQLAVDAADSSAGKFWQPGAFRRFLDEAAYKLAREYGDPASERSFAAAPVILVAYSGGFLPAAFSLQDGGVTERVRGVVLLDAAYGRLDTFANWIGKDKSGFFLSAYTQYTQGHNSELKSMMAARRIALHSSLGDQLSPGTATFIGTGREASHMSYVTRAWADDPLKIILSKLPEFARPDNTPVASINRRRAQTSRYSFNAFTR
jgi:hypothetical protein